VSVCVCVVSAVERTGTTQYSASGSKSGLRNVTTTVKRLTGLQLTRAFVSLSFTPSSIVVMRIHQCGLKSSVDNCKHTKTPSQMLV